jgi:FAD/FMN-containing dehydrogenase/Fe-S oxidoreductase
MDFNTARRDSLVRYLRRHLAGEVRFDDTSRRLYSTDASHYQIQPLGVVLPKTTDDLQVTVQIAAELGIPITARGGGTSLSGQAIGPGVVLDCSKYLTDIGEVDVTGRRVRIQPGVVLDQLNREVARFGLTFGPDVATASRATLGGMIGNNSAGSRSVVYGQTSDHVRTLSVVLSDGSTARFGRLTPLEYERKLEARTREGDAYRAADRAVRENSGEIDRQFPKILRRVSGYNLPAVLEGMRGQGYGIGHNGAPPSPLPLPSLVPLLVGSEGTLAVIAEAELELVPRPKYRGLLVPQFDSLAAALDTLAACRDLGPSAVELMDRMLIELARGQRALRDTMAAVQGRPEALLMVEFSSDDPADVSYRVHELARRIRSVPGLTAVVPALEPSTREPLWNLRTAALPLLFGMVGDRKPVTFVEDCAVTPERLPEFARQFREILHRHGTDGAFYGHASVGCLHIRPVLNLHDPTDVRKMRSIMVDVTDLVKTFGGSLSGEHGDGMVRSEWNRKMFGPVVYEAFRVVKRGFDPGNILNPGKVVDGPAMDENFRVRPGSIPLDPPTAFDYSSQGGFFRSIELCNGVGVCRKTQGGAMCPSYRVTRDEQDTTRARANALRIALQGGRREPQTAYEQTPPSSLPRTPRSALTDRWIAEVMDLCLSCKACKSECPSNVDMAKLKAEFLHAYYSRRVRPLGHLLVKNIHRLSPLAASWAGVGNWLARRPLVRRALESLAGIDRRRSLPPFHQDHFRRWFSERGTRNAERGTEEKRGTRNAERGTEEKRGTRNAERGTEDLSFTPRSALRAPRSVVLLDDCFTTFQEPGIGRAAVELLERAGFEVELAGVCCGRAMISKGFLTEARTLAMEGVAKLDRYASEGIPILGLEPSCLLTLSDEWPELVPGAAAKRVAALAELADGWLARHIRESSEGPDAAVQPRRGLFHGHCHQKALVGVSGTVDALRCVPGLDVTMLDAGCCGMAGAFGFEKEHYDVSVAVANLALIPALETEPSALVIATGTSCRHQIHDLTGRRAWHPLEVMAGMACTTPAALPRSGEA